MTTTVAQTNPTPDTSTPKKVRWWHRLAGRVWSWSAAAVPIVAQGALQVADWAVELSARLFVVCIVGSVVWFVYALAISDPFSMERWRLTSTLSTLDSNWKVLLVVLVPLFYRVVRILLEEVDTLGTSYKRRPQPEATRRRSNPVADVEQDAQ